MSSRFRMPSELTENWELAALLLIFLLAMSVRLVPTIYGTLLDPDAFFMFRMARDVVEDGYYPTWDNLGWQPYGRPLDREMPMLSFAIAYSFIFLKSLGSGLTLESWAVAFPAIVGALSVFPAYLMGRELGDRRTGLVAALLLATMPEFLNRSIGGVADKESLAFPLLLMGFALIIRVLRQDDARRNVLYGLLAGFMLGLVALTWGGYTYVILLMIVFFALVIFLEAINAIRVRDSTLLGLLISSASMLFVSQGIPNWHLDNPFIFMQSLSLLAMLAYFLLTRVAVPRGWASRRLALSVFLALVILLAAMPLYGPSIGLMKFNIARKFLILLNAFETPETGMHTTVQEYARPTAGDWFRSYSIYIFVALAGGVFALRRRRLEDIFVLLWAGSGFYAGLSAIRSTMLLTPALCLLSAVAVTGLLEIISRRHSLDQLLSSRSGKNLQVLKNELRLAKLSPGLAAGILVLLMMPSILLGVQLVQGRGPVLGQGWYDALKWLGKETPEDSILVAWWDYGHFITSVARKRCVTDGATTNYTAIQDTALAFLSPEDEAIKIYDDYDVEYVIVPEHDFWLVGAFAQIVGNVTDYPEGYFDIDSDTGSISWSDLTPKAQNTTVFKLLFAQPDPESKNFELIHISPGSGTTSDTTVRIYKVNYRQVLG